MKFSKYQGTGNDFIMIDNRTLFFDKENVEYIHQLCERRFGIGADGLILLEEDKDVDFKMVYYNADGRKSTMCGNGGRCIVAFAKELGVINKKNVLFRAIDGLHHAEIEDKEVKLQMNVDEYLEQIDENSFFINTGSPHVVKIVEEMPANFVEEAKKIRHNERFNREGVNVNFITIKEDKYQIRTFERGVEDETLSCGTGNVAAGIVLKNKLDKKIFKLATRGGFLEILFDESIVYLKGSAVKTFDGYF
ncbi:MAG: diaminopimelate epimerase [Bacteroidetes bacterium]|nr:diaminopimelate epimerase [Bacteroidota bacterium]MCB9226295.1 diaminopimelate epimerase [Chitinophagales bacterium]